MRIAQIAPPFQSIAPDGYGSTERVVSLLTEELGQRGHDVTLFARGDSATSARLIPTVDTARRRQSEGRDPLVCRAITAGMAYRSAAARSTVPALLGDLACSPRRSSRVKAR